MAQKNLSVGHGESKRCRSQGSVATYLGVVGSLMATFVQVYCQVSRWKNFANRSAFGDFCSTFLTRFFVSSCIFCHKSAVRVRVARFAVLSISICNGLAQWTKHDYTFGGGDLRCVAPSCGMRQKRRNMPHRNASQRIRCEPTLTVIVIGQSSVRT